MDGHTKVLRYCIVAHWLSVPIGLAAAFAFPPSLPPEIEEYFDAQHGTFPDWLDGVVAIGWLSLWLIGTIGAFKLWARARAIYLAACVASLAVALTMAPEISAPIPDALAEVDYVMSGVVLGLLYFSDARQHFERS